MVSKNAILIKIPNPRPKLASSLVVHHDPLPSVTIPVAAPKHIVLRRVG